MRRGRATTTEARSRRARIVVRGAPPYTRSAVRHTTIRSSRHRSSRRPIAARKFAAMLAPVPRRARPHPRAAAPSMPCPMAAPMPARQAHPAPVAAEAVWASVGGCRGRVAMAAITRVFFSMVRSPLALSPCSCCHGRSRNARGPGAPARYPLTHGRRIRWSPRNNLLQTGDPGYPRGWAMAAREPAALRHGQVRVLRRAGRTPFGSGRAHCGADEDVTRS